MKKLSLLAALVVLCVTTVFIACKKGNNSAVKSTTSKAVSVKNTSRVTETINVRFIQGSKSDPTIAAVLGCNTSLQQLLASLPADVLQSLFDDYPWLKGYVINFRVPIDGYNTSILFCYDDNVNHDFGIIRKWKGTTDAEGRFTGEFILNDLTGAPILKNTYANGIRTSEVNNFESWVNDDHSPACRPNTGDPLYIGHCTKAQFNAAYTRAKNECESDWMCDLACHFNPCFISYLASAIIDCKS